MTLKMKRLMMVGSFLLVGVILLGSPRSLRAADGDLDPSFNSGHSLDGAVRAIVVQPDGKIIIGGLFTSFDGTVCNHIARLNSDGSLDAKFNPGTGANSNVNAIAVQPDGRIIIAGNFTSFAGTTRIRVARLNEGGSLDTSFDPIPGPDRSVLTTSLQADGKIIIGGDFLGFVGMFNRFDGIARLNTNGSLDTSFDPVISGKRPDTIRGVSLTAVQTDGKIIIGELFILGRDIPIRYIERLNQDGSLDTSFAPGTGPDSSLDALTVQPDGKIIVGGLFATFNGTTVPGIARLNMNGSVDTSFNPNLLTNSFVSRTAVQADGKIIIGGNLWYPDFRTSKLVLRLNANGTVDNSFNSPNLTGNFLASPIAVQPDGKIIVGAGIQPIARLLSAPDELSFSTSSYAVSEGDPNPTITLTRKGNSGNKVVAKVTFTDVTTSPSDYNLHPGSVDSSFNLGWAPAGVRTITVQDHGKVIIGGEFTSSKLTPNALNRIARLNPDGSLDLTFNPGGLGANGTVYTTALQPDGKIIIGGDFTSYNDTPRGRIARLKSDGSLDLTFDPGVGADTLVRTIALQADGKIIIGGFFTAFGGIPQNYIARLNSDGLLDSSFNTGSGANNFVRTITVQSDDRIIIGGFFTAFNGIPRGHIARLTADGSLDSSFLAGTMMGNAVFTTALQADDRIIMGGDFSGFNGTARKGIARLNSDGSLDLTFDPGTGANGLVYATPVQVDDKIIISGNFNTYNGTTRNGIARLNPDGSLDTSVDPSMGVRGTLFAAAPLADGKVITGGDLTFRRLNGDLLVVWEAGDYSDKSLALPTVDDGIAESDETATLTLTPLIGAATTGLYPSATLTIIDNESAATGLSVAHASGTYNGSATLTATLTATGSPLSGKTVSFKLNNNAVGTATTDGNGVATLSGVSLAGINAGTYDGAVEASFAGESAYRSSLNTGTLKIDKVVSEVAWNNPATIAYGTALGNTQLNATANVPGTFTYTPAGGTVLRAGNSQSLHVDFTPADTSNYNTASMDVSINVAKATLTIKADDKSRFYGDGNPAFTYSASGFAGGDTASVITGAPDFSTSATPASPVSSYAIKPSTGTLNTLTDYAYVFVNGALSVNKAQVMVTGNDISRAYGDANPAFTATLSAFKNGETLATSGVTGSAACTSAATPASSVSGGPYSITCTVGTLGAVNYDFAPFVNGTLTITRAPLTLTAANASRSYGDANPAFAGTITGLKNGDAITASYSTTATTASAVGNFDIVPAAVDSSPATLGNYTVTLVNGTITISKAAVLVTAADATRAYGDANPVFSGSITGIRNNDNVAATYATSATTASTVGNYSIVPTLVDPDGKLSNYNVAYQDGALTVTKASLSVTVRDASRAYGDANPSFTGTITGVRNGDNIAGTYASTATEASFVGSYGIIPTLVDPGSTLGNYNLTSSDGTLTVIRAPLTIRAENQTKIYGDSNPALTGVVNGIKNGDAITASYSTSATGASNVGSYQIVPAVVDSSPSRLDNYEVTLVNSTLTVSRAALVVTVSDKLKTYGDLNPEFTGTITGLKDSDAIGATYASAATTTSSVGTYPIIPALQDASGKLINYQVTATNGTLTVVKATLTITWTNPADVPQGTALSSTQLNATASFQGASVAGIFIYTPALGTILNAGTQQTLLVSFTPANTANFNSPATASVKLNVLTIQQAAGNVVTGLVTAGLIPQGSVTTVTNEVVNAVLAINNSSPATRAQAVTLLQSYVSVIGVQVATGRLPAAQGQALTATLNSLIGLIKP